MLQNRLPACCSVTCTLRVLSRLMARSNIIEYDICGMNWSMKLRAMAGLAFMIESNTSVVCCSLVYEILNGVNEFCMYLVDRQSYDMPALN